MNSTEWEAKFSAWGKPPGDAEEQRIQNTIRAIRKAMDADEALSLVTKVYVQGSYRNRVNVRQDSDVDIGILYTGNSFYPHYPLGKGAADFGNTVGNKTYGNFKNEVGAALVKHFGNASVTRGNKAFDIHENTYRVDCDVVPVFVHRRYFENKSYVCGVCIYPDDGSEVINWPERLIDEPAWPNQHYENSVKKNADTARAYKSVVRIVKKLRNLMDEAGNQSAADINGFLVECLVWNANDLRFGGNTWDEVVQNVFRDLWNRLQKEEDSEEWTEISGYKWLFKNEPGKRDKAFKFINAAWDVVGVRQ